MRKSTQSVTTLQNEKSYLSQLVKELKAENAKLQKKIARFEAKNVTLQNRVKSLEKEKPPNKRNPMSNLEAARRLLFLLNSAGLDIHGKPLSKK